MDYRSRTLPKEVQAWFAVAVAPIVSAGGLLEEEELPCARVLS
jgi:hypothetical protein